MSRKSQARELLNNPIFIEMTGRLKASLYEEWLNSESVKERETVFAKVEILENLMSDLNALILETSK